MLRILASRGPVLQEGASRPASSVDRILEGEKAAEIPVEAPTTVERVLNLKSARTIGLDVPRAVPLRADRVTEQDCRRGPGRRRQRLGSTRNFSPVARAA